jgi:hypothetical protein
MVSLCETRIDSLSLFGPYPMTSRRLPDECLQPTRRRNPDLT